MYRLPRRATACRGEVKGQHDQSAGRIRRTRVTVVRWIEIGRSLLPRRRPVRALRGRGLGRHRAQGRGRPGSRARGDHGPGPGRRYVGTWDYDVRASGSCVGRNVSATCSRWRWGRCRLDDFGRRHASRTTARPRERPAGSIDRVRRRYRRRVPHAAGGGPRRRGKERWISPVLGASSTSGVRARGASRSTSPNARRPRTSVAAGQLS